MIKKPQIIMMIASSAVRISITRLSPNPSPLMTSACALSMASCVVVPAEISPTRFPMEVKNAFIIVTLLATNHSASPNRISIRRIDSNLISSFTSILSEQKPITKNSTTREEPTATKIGSIPSISKRKTSDFVTTQKKSFASILRLQQTLNTSSHSAGANFGALLIEQITTLLSIRILRARALNISTQQTTLVIFLMLLSLHSVLKDFSSHL